MRGLGVARAGRRASRDLFLQYVGHSKQASYEIERKPPSEKRDSRFAKRRLGAGGWAERGADPSCEPLNVPENGIATRKRPKIHFSGDKIAAVAGAVLWICCGNLKGRRKDIGIPEYLSYCKPVTILLLVIRDAHSVGAL